MYLIELHVSAQTGLCCNTTGEEIITTHPSCKILLTRNVNYVQKERNSDAVILNSSRVFKNALGIVLMVYQPWTKPEGNMQIINVTTLIDMSYSI